MGRQLMATGVAIAQMKMVDQNAAAAYLRWPHGDHSPWQSAGQCCLHIPWQPVCHEDAPLKARDLELNGLALLTLFTLPRLLVSRVSEQNLQLPCSVPSLTNSESLACL